MLKALEDAGRIRRGYFVSGVGATQFALPAALELMRSLREMPDEPEVVMISATDPANPFGTMLQWPSFAGARSVSTATAGKPSAGTDGRGATRTAGAVVILVNGTLAAYLSRGARQLLVDLPEDEPQRSAIARPLSQQLASVARTSGLLIAEINGTQTSDHPLAPYLEEAGFRPSAMGFMVRREAAVQPSIEPATPKLSAQPEA